MLKKILAEVQEIKTMLAVSEWFNESDAEKEVGIAPETLRKMRWDSKHNAGWRCRMHESKDLNKKPIMRGVQWKKSYINSLYVQKSTPRDD